MPTQFNGQTVILPGTLTSVNDQALNSVQPGGTTTIALVGQANNGQPKTPIVCNNPSDLALNFASGPLVDAGNIAFLHGANQIIGVNVNPATQASLTLDDGSSNPSLALTSTIYGSAGNSVQVSIASGTNANTKNVVIQYLPTNFTAQSTTVASTGLGQAFTFQYTGNGSGATATISNALSAPTISTLSTATTGGTIPASTAVYAKVTALNASGETIGSAEETITVGSSTSTNTVTVPWTAVAGATKYNIYASTTTGTETYQHQVLGGSSNSYTLTSIATGGASVPATNTTGKNLSTVISGQTDSSLSLDIPLNGVNGTTWTTLGALVNYLNGQAGYTATLLGSPSLATQYLDTVSGQNILSSAQTETAQLGAIIDWINKYGSVVTAAAASNGTATNAPANTSLVNLAGGSNGTPQTSDWQTAVQALETVNCAIVVPISGSSSVISTFETERVSLANQGVAYRSGVYGLAWGSTDAQITTQAQQLNDGGAQLVAPGYVGNSSLGVQTNFDGFYMAAAVAGLIAGQDSVAHSVTGQGIKVAQLERNFTLTEQQSLLPGGVTLIVPQRTGGFKVLEDRASSVTSTNLYDTQAPIRRAVNQVRQDLQDGLNADIGAPGLGTVTQHALIQRAEAILDNEVSNGLIASYDPVTNVSQSTTNADVWNVNTTIYVEAPINHILVGIQLATA